MATRFWVGGTGTWDAATTTHWASSTGGAGGQSVPTTTDAVTFDGSSGGGTVTVNTTVTVQSITMGAFTGTLDFSANNNSVTLTTVFNNSGTGTRTLNMGNGTWTLNTSNPAAWTMTTTTGLTFNANSSTIVINWAQGSTTTFAGGGKTYNIVTLSDTALSNGQLAITGANTFATLNITAGSAVLFPAGPQTITNAPTWTGTPTSPILLLPASFAVVASINSGNNAALSWTGISNITFGGAGTHKATNSLDFRGNTGITITPPSTGGAGFSGFVK